MYTSTRESTDEMRFINTRQNELSVLLIRNFGGEVGGGVYMYI